jgi:hypothetical protein
MDNVLRLTRTAAAVVTLAGASLVAFASPASASVPGLERTARVSAPNSSSPKSITATCPTGKQPIGTGFYLDYLDGGAGELVLDDLTPTSTGVLATGYEDQDGTAAEWWIRSVAFCANPLPGMQLVSVTSAYSSNAKSVTAACPSGKVAIGNGANITGGLGQVVISTMRASGTAAIATAYEDADGTTASWTLTTYAVCAYAPAGLETIAFKSPTDSSASKALWPACSAGKKLLSVGWEIVGTEPGRVFPEVAMGNNDDDGLVVAKEHGPSVDSNWTLSASIVCATP